MSFKDKVRWVQRVELHRHYDSHRPSGPPITDLDLVPAIPVEALRAWLEEQHTSIVGKATVAAMLAELEGVA